MPFYLIRVHAKHIASLAVAGLCVALVGWFSFLIHAPVRAGSSLPAHKVNLRPSAVLSGDLVFRRGRSMVSRAVLSLDGRSEFSHVGIAVRQGDHLVIIHAVPPEEDARSAGVIAEPLELFLSPRLASSAALYRPKSATAGMQAAVGAWKYAAAKTPFDSAFDLTTSRAVYCTELVWRVYLEANVDLIGRDFHERYLLPSRLLNSPELRLIEQINEKESP